MSRAEDGRAQRVGEILAGKFESHKSGYTHPATARINELLREGWTIIAKDVPMQNVGKHYPEGSVWMSTGDVLSPPAKRQEKAA